MSHCTGSALPPAASISSAALKIVPGSFGFASAVFAAMTMLAPSAAARLAIARPMPRDAPVMKRVLPFRSFMRVSPV